MKRKEEYDAPHLNVVAIVAEQGFSASASSIENPSEVIEDANYWS